MIQPWLQQIGANPPKTYTLGHDLADQLVSARYATSEATPVVHRYRWGATAPMVEPFGGPWYLAKALRRTIGLMSVANRIPEPHSLARVLERHGDEVKRIAASNGATNLRLVGSVARGEEHEGSDIDLLVDFGPDRSLFDHAQLVEELKALLGVPVDVVSSRGLKPKVRDRLLQDARPL